MDDEPSLRPPQPAKSPHGSWTRWPRRLWLAALTVIPALQRTGYIAVVLTAVFLGLASGYGAIAFRELIRLGHQAFFATDEYSIALLEALPWWRRLLQPALGGLAVGLIVTYVAREVRGSGIPEVMESVARRAGAIRFRVAVTKALAAAITITSGGSAGREGPVVHIGAAVSSFVGQLLKVSAARLRTYVACGTAGAIAATFNAPIAGALFAVEVVLADFAVAHLSPIVISSVVATIVSRHYLGDFPAFDVPGYDLHDPRELLLYAALGVLAACIGVVFIRVLYAVSDRFERSRIPEVLRPAVGGLGVGLITLGFPHVYGVGYETINAALWANLSGFALVALVIAKLLATSFTLGSGGSGGVFAPSLFLGAVLGAAFGNGVNLLFPEWTANPGAYALVGMGAVVAGTTHAPITAILIIFELTNDYRIIPPLMLSCVIAVLLASLMYRENIYSARLIRRGIRLTEQQDPDLLRGILVREVMHKDVSVVSAGLPFAQLMPRLLGEQRMQLVVVDDAGQLLGVVALSDVRAGLPDSDHLAGLVLTADVMDRDVPCVLPTDRLDVVMRLFEEGRREDLPVVSDSQSRCVVGYVAREDVIVAYNRRILELDRTGAFRSVASAVHHGHTIEISPGLHISEIDAPPALVGQTIQECKLRQALGVEVVLIHRREMANEPGGRLLPSPDIVLCAGDRLLVIGSDQSIRQLSQ